MREVAPLPLSGRVCGAGAFVGWKPPRTLKTGWDFLGKSKEVNSPNSDYSSVGRKPPRTLKTPLDFLGKPKGVNSPNSGYFLVRRPVGKNKRGSQVRVGTWAGGCVYAHP